MGKVELEPRGNYSPAELIDIYKEIENPTPADIITLGRKLGLDDPNYFYYEFRDKNKRGKYYEPTEEGSALRKKYVPKVLKDLQDDYFAALDDINLVTKETDRLPAYELDGKKYETEKFDIRKQPGSRGASKSDLEEMERVSEKIQAQPGPILDDDEPEAKKGFFDKLLSKENRPFLENLGMQLGVNLTKPLSPGENRSLVNQVARSVQGADVATTAQEKAQMESALKAAQAEKALQEARGGTDLYKKAVEFVTSKTGMKPTDPNFGAEVAKAMRTFGVKDISMARVNAFTKLVQAENELKLIENPESEEYKRKRDEINKLKALIFDEDFDMGDGRNVVKFGSY